MSKTFAAAALTTLLLGATAAGAQSIQITPNRTTPSAIGAAENFTGHVVVDPLFPATEETRATTGLVTFAPGARTAWHTHPAGQLLIVTEGKGWVQEEGQERGEITPGDVVWIPAGVRHWHGATDTSGMSHIAVSYMLDGKNVEWQDLVTDQEYGAD
ncbi:MAG: cupin domain-containing protein [Shinella sp.]|nr:cupin domain-containing protein [Shinella sp.]